MKSFNNDWPLVSIVSVNWNQEQLTREMLDSLSHVTYPNLEVILVDNGSTKGDASRLKAEFPHIRFLRLEENTGFAGGNNAGFRMANGKYVLLLNNDTLVDPHFLQPMVNTLECDPWVGVVSPKIYFVDHQNTVQYAGTSEIHPITSRGQKYGYRQRDGEQYAKSGVTGLANGACMLVRKRIIDTLGGLPEIYFLYYEEHDFTVQLQRHGYVAYYQADASIWHRGSSSTGRGSTLKAYFYHRNRLLFVRRNQRGMQYLLALAYLFGIAYPKAFLSYALSRQWAHIRAMASALGWHLSRADIRPINRMFVPTR
ncbi:MAG TPA: hypothetical protein DCE41_20085 [Cytophagales bacterium]|nr:hypothetical protein [Cytophagales bacterium]